MLQSGAVFFVIFISLCLRLVTVSAADSRRTNLTAVAVAASADNSPFFSNISSIGGVKVKGTNDDTLPVADDEDDVPPKDVAPPASEGSKVTHKWETGKLIVLAIIGYFSDIVSL